MRKTLLWGLVFISFLALATRFAFSPLQEAIGFQSRAGVKVLSTPSATVLLNGQEVGKTPYEDTNLKAGEYQVKLAEGEKVWQGVVKLNKGTISIINRELGESISASSGDTLALNSGQGVVLTSLPSGAKVEVDGQVLGTTPLLFKELSAGEHTFIFSKDQYLLRSVRALLPPKMQLHLDVDLAVSENRLTPLPVPSITPVQQIKVGTTPLGFLRVRRTPSVQGEEVARVSQGDLLDVVGELPGWYKVKLENGKEGYVSASYVQKQT